MKKQKRGFTLLELVIVIAVIAILAAVIIPTFSAIIKRSRTSNDIVYCKNMNTFCATAEVNSEKAKTMQDALDVLVGEGILLSNLKASNEDTMFVWDSTSNRFFVYNFVKGEVIFHDEANDIILDAEHKNKYWIMSDTYAQTNDNLKHFSVYLKNGYDGTKTLNISTGVDVGENVNIEEINYTSESDKEITIRSNGGAVTVTAPNAIVNHYGYADNVSIVSVDTASYHEFGTVPFIEISKGKVVIEDNSKVSHVHFNKKNDTSFDDIIIKKAEETSMPEFSRDSIDQTVEQVLIVEVQTKGTSKFVWLEGNGTIEDSKVLVSTSKTGSKTVVEQETAENYVLQIVNKKTQGGAVVDGGVDKEATKTAVIDNHYSGETTATNIPNGTYAYYSYYGELVTFDSDANNFNNLPDGTTLTICRDMNFNNSVLEIVDKSITIKGVASRPTVYADFYIHHTSGNHTVTIKNLNIVKIAANTQKDIIKDQSVATSSTDANVLLVEDCEFNISMTGSQNAVVAVYPTGGASTFAGTALTFKGNTVSSSLGGKFASIIAVGCTQEANKTDPSSHGRTYVQPVMDSNTITNPANYIYVGTSIKMINNTIDNARRVAQVYAAVPTSTLDGELNVVIKNNTIRNITDYIMKLYKASEVAGTDYAVVDIAGTTGIDANIFENVTALANIDGSSSAFGTQIAIEYASRTFTGITNSGIDFTLSKTKLTQQGNVEIGNMTLPSGESVITYTQAVEPQGGRTGFYVTVGTKTMWYFADIDASNHYFIDDDNNKVYVVRFVAGGSSGALSISSDPIPEEITNEGIFYQTSFVISTIDGNTIYNASAEKTGNKIVVTPTANNSYANINLFISNIDNKTKLLITSNTQATADNDTMIYVVSEKVGQINTYGNWQVTIDADMFNYKTTGRQTITVNENIEVSRSLQIVEKTAKETVLTNNGSIGVLRVHSKSTVTNNNFIRTLYVANVEAGYTGTVIESVKNSCDSVITNFGTINTVYSGTRINFTNKADATVNSFAINCLLSELFDESIDSVIVNKGLMCQTKGSQIDLLVKCKFTNDGTIGVMGRGISVEHTQEGLANCEDYGGIIIIGYSGYSTAHNGLEFINNGIIYAGSRHNGFSHQQMTLWVFGSIAQISNPIIVKITNNGVIYGDNNVTEYSQNSLVINSTDVDFVG